MRSKELAKLSAQLRKNDLRNELMRSFLGRRWNMFGSFGLWVFDPFFGGHCFVPFGYGWSSPYGFGYGHNIWWYDMPPVIYNPPNSGGWNPGGGSNPPAVTPIVSAGDRSPIPPFIRMEQTMGGGVRGGGGGRGDSGGAYDSGSNSSPTYSSSSSSSSPSSGSSSPASTGTKSDPTGTKP